MSTSAVSPAAKTAYETVKTRILSGALPATEMLTEGELATELGISRTPVREAFLRLEVEGHLRLYPKRGAMVVPISPAEIHDLFEARLLIESHAAQRICTRPEPSRQRLLEVLGIVLEQQDAAIAADDLSRYAELDAQFHHHVISMGNNALLTDVATGIRERQQRLVAASVEADSDRARDYMAGHHALLKRLEAADATGYRAELEAHLNSAKAALL